MSDDAPPSSNEWETLVPPYVRWFEPGSAPADLAIELLLIERRASSYDHWRVTGALVREPGKPPRWHDDQVDGSFSADPVTLWDYMLEKGGGNGVTWEVGFLRIAAVDDIPAIIAHISEMFRQEPVKERPMPREDETVAPPQGGDELEDAGESVAADPCQQHAHVAVPLAAADVLTWQLAVELVRRHPNDLWILRTYPMGGGYDCLSIRRLPDVLTSNSIEFNRGGTHVQVGDLSGRQEALDHPLMSWGDPYAQPDPGP
jgi:hypothetical protein